MSECESVSEGRFPEKNCCSFGFCPNKGGGPCHLFISAFLVNKRSLFPPNANNLNFKLFFRLDIHINERMREGILARSSTSCSLIRYRLVKRMEHTFKAIIHDGVGDVMRFPINFCFRTQYPYTNQPSMQIVSRSLCQTRFSEKPLKVSTAYNLHLIIVELNGNCN